MAPQQCPRCGKFALDFDKARRVWFCVTECGYASEPEPSEDQRIGDLEAENRRLREALDYLVEYIAHIYAIGDCGYFNPEDMDNEGAARYGKARQALAEVRRQAEELLRGPS